jgi:P-type conjugative transfer protein TrbJ
MRKLKKITALCLLFVFAANAAAAGGGISGGATELTQIANNAELVAQVAQLAEQIQNQITMIQDLIYNTLTIPDQIFRDVKGVYTTVKGIIDKTKGLVYNLANLDEELKRRFKSYSDLSKISQVEDFSTEYRNIVGARMETVRSSMEAIGVSMEELIKDDASALSELQKKARSAKGRNELIQATNQLLGFLAEDAMKLRQLAMIQAQTAATVYEAERAQGELSDRRIEAFFKRDDVNLEIDERLNKGLGGEE